MSSDPVYDALMRRAGMILARREHGAQELRMKLSRPRPREEPPPDETVEEVIERLTELGLVNDQALLARLLEEKYNEKCHDERGRWSVYQALRRRGFRHGDVRAAMRDFAECDIEIECDI